MDLSHSENIILRHVLSTPTYLDTCKREFFKNESFGEILIAAKEFWDKYHEMPTSDQLIEAFKLKGNSDNVDKSEIRSVYDIDLSQYEDEWLKETTEFFVEYKNQAFDKSPYLTFLC
jgi:hypothetical protein